MNALNGSSINNLGYMLLNESIQVIAKFIVDHKLKLPSIAEASSGAEFLEIKMLASLAGSKFSSRAVLVNVLLTSVLLVYVLAIVAFRKRFRALSSHATVE
jgi:hypothetical protein